MSGTVSDFLLQRMSEWGVKRVYGNPGDGINDIIGAFGRSENGPGAIHLLSGLYDAQMDHAPVVAIVGQQTRAAIGGSYQQEMDLISPLEGVARTCFVGLRVFAAYRGRTADLEQVRATPLKSESRIPDSGSRTPSPESLTPAFRRTTCQRKQSREHVRMNARGKHPRRKRVNSCARKWNTSGRASTERGHHSRPLPLGFPKRGVRE